MILWKSNGGSFHPNAVAVVLGVVRVKVIRSLNDPNGQHSLPFAMQLFRVDQDLNCFGTFSNVVNLAFNWIGTNLINFHSMSQEVSNAV